MNWIRLALLCSLAIGLACAQKSVMVAAGAVPGGFTLWTRAGGTCGVETAYARRVGELLREPGIWVLMRQTETLEGGGACRARWRRFAVYGGGGVSRETVLYTIRYLYSHPEEFGGSEQHIAPYASAAATFRLFRNVHAFGRYTWRGNAAFAERQTIAGGLAFEF